MRKLLAVKKYIFAFLLCTVATASILGSCWLCASRERIVTVSDQELEMIEQNQELAIEISAEAGHYNFFGVLNCNAPVYEYWNFVLGEGKAQYINAELLLLKDRQTGIRLPFYLKNTGEWIAYLSKNGWKRFLNEQKECTYMIRFYDLDGALCDCRGGRICIP